MTATITRWGDPTTNIHMFKDTPFGTVVLNNFQKTAPEMFTIWMYVLPEGKVPTYEQMTVTWWNCHADDARDYFGIERSEQNMWGS